MLRVYGLRSAQKILTELIAQVNVDFIEAALAVTETCEVLDYPKSVEVEDLLDE